MKLKYLAGISRGLANLSVCGMVGGMGGFFYSAFAKPDLGDAPQQQRLDTISEQRQNLDEQLLTCVPQENAVPDDCLTLLRQYVTLGQEAADIRGSAGYQQLTRELQEYQDIGFFSLLTVGTGIALGYGVSIPLLAYAERRRIKESVEEERKAHEKPSGDKAQ